MLEQFFPVGDSLRLLERALVVAAVVGQSSRCMEREFRRLREILQANLYRINVQLIGDEIHDPFYDISRLGPASAAVGIGSHFVRVNTSHVHPHGLALVATGEQEAGEGGNRGSRELAISANVSNRPRLDGE